MASDAGQSDNTTKEIHLSQAANHETNNKTIPASITPVFNQDGSDGDKNEYPGGLRLAMIMIALCLTIFCVALDNTITSTATPVITDEFHSLQDIGWYGSAYLLLTCAFQLFYGKLYTLFDIKLIYLIALLIFEVGSAVSGAAPSSAALIVGRAIAGLGAGGLYSGSFVIIAHSVPVYKRPIFQGFAGMTYGIASVLGPIIGGAFTTHVTWRWCFYINLPLGGAAAVIILFFLQLPKSKAKESDTSVSQSLWRLDPIGTVLFVPSIICLLLALQWGGTTYAWNSGRIIALLVVFCVSLIAFIGVQIWLGEIATVPPRIASQRTVAFASLFAFLIGIAFIVFTYFIPIWFQAIKGVNALTSGIHVIPMILSMTIAIILAGGLTTKIGYYMPFIYASTILASVGSGLITTWKPDTGSNKWIGYQVIFGLGCGLGFQLPQIAAQTVLPIEDIAIGTAMTFFAQLFGAAVFVSVGNNILNTSLVKKLAALQITSIDPLKVVSLGATEIRSYVPAQFLGLTLEAYNQSLVKTFQVALIVSCLTLIGAVGMEWKNVKEAVSENTGEKTEKVENLP